MEPLEGHFKAPTFDFFKPRHEQGVSDFLGVECRENGLYLVFHDFPYNRYSDGPRRRYRSKIPHSAITKIYINDLGGWSIDFSDQFEYNWCGGGGVQITFPNERVVRSFNYDVVARVRKPDSTVVWENYDVPKDKKLLRLIPLKTQ